MKLVNRVKKIEETQREKSIMLPVFVDSLDELDTRKRYSIIFCENDDIHRASEFDYEKLFYGEIKE